MKMLRHGLVLAVLCLIPLAPCSAGAPIKHKGTISIGMHEIPMKAGTVYLLKAEGVGFRPQLDIDQSFLNFINNGFDEGKPVEAYIVPDRDQTHTVYVAPSTFSLRGKKGPFEYSLTVTPVNLDAKPLLNKQDALTNNDPAYKNEFNMRKNHKAYSVKLEALQFYMIDLMRRGDNSLDCYLYLEDPAGKIVASDDDGGDGLNSRIVFRPQTPGTYRIIATNLGDQVGDFTLSVRGQQKE